MSRGRKGFEASHQLIVSSRGQPLKEEAGDPDARAALALEKSASLAVRVFMEWGVVKGAIESRIHTG